MGQQIDYGNVAAGMAMDATGSLINNLNNELQMERTFGFNERAAKNADARTRALFTDLYSPEAKVKQLKEAGLSVLKRLFGGEFLSINPSGFVSCFDFR